MTTRVRRYKGGIYSHTDELPDPPAALLRALDLCSCGGDAHDECAEPRDTPPSY